MSQNIKKALWALDYLEKKHLEFAQNLKLKIVSWEDTGPRSLGFEIAETHEVQANNLRLIKKLLLEKPKRKIAQKNS